MPETSLDLTIACGKLRQRLADVEWRATVAETLYDQKCAEVAQLQADLHNATAAPAPGDATTSGS